jgi:hypothetical protein
MFEVLELSAVFEVLALSRVFILLELYGVFKLLVLFVVFELFALYELFELIVLYVEFVLFVLYGVFGLIVLHVCVWMCLNRFGCVWIETQVPQVTCKLKRRPQSSPGHEPQKRLSSVPLYSHFPEK